MKKVFLFVIFSMLAISLVFAAQGTSVKQGDTSVTVGDDGSVVVNTTGKVVKVGPNDMDVDVNENGEKLRVRIQDFENHSFMNASGDWDQNRTQLRIELSNGRNAEIKVMPSTASSRAIERLGINVCNQSNNCSIQLKEVGTGNQTRAAYEVQAQKEARVFGIFKTQMNVSTEIDAETEEVIKTSKPWWAFLASE